MYSNATAFLISHASYSHRIQVRYSFRLSVLIEQGTFQIGSISVVAAMENTPLPPPFLNIPGMTNFRPVADYPIGSPSANDGPRRVVRPGVIYRGSDPSQAPIESIRRLHDECGITTIFDLRSVESIRGRGGGEHLVEAFEEKCKEVGIQRHWIPVIDKEETTPYKVAQRFVSFMEDSTDVRSLI